MTAARRLLAAAALLLCAAAPAVLRAQDIHISGDDDSRAARVAREVLARHTYILIDRDTILPADFHAPADLVVYDAEVKLEGTVDGTVAVIGGHFFVRPRAKVVGPIAVIGGDVYRSALATTGEVLYPGAGTGVALAGDSASADTTTYGATLIPPARPKAFALVPAPLSSYDRVNGVTLSAGVRLLPTRNDSGPRIDAWAAYRFENPDRIGGGVRFDLPLRMQGVHLTAVASRATRTNDAWMRGDLSNSVSVLTTGRDYRDYYDADRALVMFRRPVGKPLIAGESWLGPRGGIQWEQDRSLERHHVFSFLESRDKDRVNPPITDGTLVSAFAGTELHWIGRISAFHGSADVEQSLPGLSSDAIGAFTQVVGEGTYTTLAFRTHTVRVFFHGMAPVAGDAPPQRYGILGGPATLPTLRIGRFRGDHLAFFDARYAIPLPVTLPFVGMPFLESIYSTGAAWTGDTSPSWVQNVGAGLRFSLVGIEVLVDPTDRPLKPKLNLSLAIPRI